MQSKLASLLEAKSQVAVGFFISWGVWVWVVAPLFGYPTDYLKGFAITCIFTVTSLARQYVIRRISNHLTKTRFTYVIR